MPQTIVAYDFVEKNIVKCYNVKISPLVENPFITILDLGTFFYLFL